MTNVQMKKNFKDYLIYIMSHNLCLSIFVTVCIWQMYQYTVHEFNLFSVLFIPVVS